MHCYAEMARMARSQREREVIEEIRQDEMKHFRDFSNIYVQLTGSQPQLAQLPACPTQYLQAIDEAFVDEQMTVDFYHSIANETLNPRVRSAFRRAAEDEQNHAVWFLYLMNK